MRSISFRAIAISSSLFLVFQIQMASAAITSNSQSNLNLATGYWRTLLASANGAGTSGPYQITWTGGSNKQNDLLAIINTGNLDLVAQHLTFSSVRSNGDITGAPTLTFETCSGAWDINTFACNGTATTIASAISGQLNVNQYVIAGSRIVLRITHTRNGSGNYISTFNTLTFRSDIRSGIAINS